MSRIIIVITFCLLGAIHATDKGKQIGESSRGPMDEDAESVELNEETKSDSMDEYIESVEPTGETSSQPMDGDIESIELLTKIERNEVLPLILFIIDKFPYPPKKILKAKLRSGRIIKGTIFQAWVHNAPMHYLCPKMGSVDKCLEYKSFFRFQPLQCSLEPSPKWSTSNIKCGKEKKGIIFSSTYKICKNNKPDQELDPEFDLTFYNICYDISSQKTLFTSHEIMSPELLNLNLLAYERSVFYPVVISDGPNFSNHPITNDVIIKNRINSKKPDYRLQQLVPHADMSFGTWRSTTYNNLNYRWQHKDFMTLWDEISENIRSIAHEYTTTKNTKIVVNTTIIDLNSTSEDDNQLFNIWMKMVYVVKVKGYVEEQLTHGIAILMNNFVYDNETSNNRQDAIEDFCEYNQCSNDLTNKFTEIGGRVRCCPIIPKILEHFPFDLTVKKKLHVPNVTVEEDE